MGQEEHCDEECGDDPGADLDLLYVAAEDADHDVGDETEGDAVGDVIGKGHERQREEGGNRVSEVAPVDVRDRHHHEEADVDQRRRRSAARDELCDRA